jgi:hypothetical protein
MGWKECLGPIYSIVGPRLAVVASKAVDEHYAVFGRVNEIKALDNEVADPL